MPGGIPPIPPMPPPGGPGGMLILDAAMISSIFSSSVDASVADFMAIFGALNIFYAMYGLIQSDGVKMLISTATHLFLMYSTAIIDAKSEELRRSDRDRARKRWS